MQVPVEHGPLRQKRPRFLLCWQRREHRKLRYKHCRPFFAYSLPGKLLILPKNFILGLYVGHRRGVWCRCGVRRAPLLREVVSVRQRKLQVGQESGLSHVGTGVGRLRSASNLSEVGGFSCFFNLHLKYQIKNGQN